MNRLGRRFTDESLGDEVSNQALLRQPDARAILIFDQHVRSAFAAAAPYPHAPVIDRLAGAVAAGGRVTQAGTLSGLAAAVAEWGVDRAALLETLEEYRTGSSAPLPVTPARLADPPFHALEVQPTITFTFGGLAVDVDGRVLDRDGGSIPGLFAAGADAGGLQDRRYVGGLILGAVFGPRAAEAALGVPVNA